MSTVLAFEATGRAPASVSTLRAPTIALLGAGTVGRAFVERSERLRARGVAVPAIAAIANSRDVEACGADAFAALARVTASARQRGTVRIAADAFARGDIVVDATACDDVAARHADWLGRGVHVVTANKLGNGTCLSRAQAIARAAREGRARYGDAATVGAGLPVLRSLRELIAGGDRIHAVEGVLSGSLAWLFHAYDGMRPFSRFVREAREAGYTEPDPRIDLSGEDVRRKLLILARATGLALTADAVDVQSLVPASLAQASADALDARLSDLDAPLRARYQQAYRDGTRLRFVGRFTVDDAGRVRADVGLRALAADHALSNGGGTDNRVVIGSDRYRERPLVIQGPGAGAEVTAAGLLDDVLRIVH